MFLNSAAIHIQDCNNKENRSIIGNEQNITILLIKVNDYTNVGQLRITRVYGLIFKERQIKYF